MAKGACEDEDVPELIAQTYLPEPLPDHWVVLPKRLLQWAAVNILLLGAIGGALLTTTLATFVPLDHIAWYVSGLIAVIYLIRKFILTPVEDEAVGEARRVLNLTDHSE